MRYSQGCALFILFVFVFYFLFSGALILHGALRKFRGYRWIVKRNREGWKP